jgi:hypothetical protein
LVAILNLKLRLPPRALNQINHSGVDVASSLKKHCEDLEKHIKSEFIDHLSGVSAREDSRAFGAMVERRITDNWEQICKKSGVEPLDIPGRRSIFDCAYKDNGSIYGLDVKTKDLDSTSYSDGGICAVGNLLKFLANDKGIFLIVEVGHTATSGAKSARDIEYIHVAPFSCLPADSYRIENLGTGQVRLNYSVNQVHDEIDWNRPNNTFFDIFTDLAISHYERVGRDAKKRIDSINAFKANGYKEFSFAR